MCLEIATTVIVLTKKPRIYLCVIFWWQRMSIDVYLILMNYFQYILLKPKCQTLKL